MKSVELFAGAGGLGMGIALAGFGTSAVIERDRYCCDTIRENKDRGHNLIYIFLKTFLHEHLISYQYHF